MKRLPIKSTQKARPDFRSGFSIALLGHHHQVVPRSSKLVIRDGGSATAPPRSYGESRIRLLCVSMALCETFIRPRRFLP